MVICTNCNLEKKHHAKGMCKPCYCKSEAYKILRKPVDKKFQTENKTKIYEVRKKRRRSIEYKESDGYIKNLIASNFDLPMKIISEFPNLIFSKKIEVKLERKLNKNKS